MKAQCQWDAYPMENIGQWWVLRTDLPTAYDPDHDGGRDAVVAPLRLGHLQLHLGRLPGTPSPRSAAAAAAAT